MTALYQLIIRPIHKNKTVLLKINIAKGLNIDNSIILPFSISTN
jgi:hypothetical protein